jgi:hypothetical protein
MSKPLQVFRSGAWIQYPLIYSQTHGDIAGWNKKYEFQAASLYATALSKGYSPLESNAFAEMYVFKQIHEGIKYDKKKETQLKDLLS